MTEPMGSAVEPTGADEPTAGEPGGAGTLAGVTDPLSGEPAARADEPRGASTCPREPTAAEEPADTGGTANCPTEPVRSDEPTGADEPTGVANASNCAGAAGSGPCPTAGLGWMPLARSSISCIAAICDGAAAGFGDGRSPGA